MIKGGLGDLLASQHAGNFFGAVFFIQRLDGCQGSAVADMLGNAEMMLTKFRNLRQVGNTYNLVVAGKFGQFAAHHFSRAAADTGIDLIKHNSFNRIGFGQNSF